MGTGFHALKVWQDAKALAAAIHGATSSGNDLSLRDRIRRSASSAPPHIAEGDERDTDRDALRFINIAKPSLAELRIRMEIATEVGLLAATAATTLLASAALLARRRGALIKARSSYA